MTQLLLCIICKEIKEHFDSAVVSERYRASFISCMTLSWRRFKSRLGLHAIFGKQLLDCDMSQLGVRDIEERLYDHLKTSMKLILRMFIDGALLHSIFWNNPKPS